jgi:hypothetical protein
METFPFHRIGVHPGSLSFGVEIHDRGTTVIAFSKECTKEARLNGCCSHCAKIPAEVQKLVDLAIQADSRVNHRYLSWSQIRSLLADRTEEVRKFRLKVSLAHPLDQKNINVLLRASILPVTLRLPFENSQTISGSWMLLRK